MEKQSRTGNPGVVTCHEIFETELYYCIVMKNMPEGSLLDHFVEKCCFHF